MRVTKQAARMILTDDNCTAAGVVVITVDPGDPDVMHHPPRDPNVPITNRAAVLFWILYSAVLFVSALVPLVAGPDTPSVEPASASMTMTFVVMGLGTVFNALTNRRDPTSGLTAPILQALAISLVSVAMVVLATQLPGLQAGLLTTSLAGLQWLECVGLALLLPLVIEVSNGSAAGDPPPGPLSMLRGRSIRSGPVWSGSATLYLVTHR